MALPGWTAVSPGTSWPCRLRLQLGCSPPRVLGLPGREQETPQEQGRVWTASVAGGWQVSVSMQTRVEVSSAALEFVSESRS